MPVNAVISYVIAMIVSGSIGLVVTESGLAAPDVVLGRCAIGAVAVAAYCVSTRSFRGVRYTWRTFALTLAGGLCIVANWVLFFTAFSFTTITITTVVYHIQPFVLALMGWAVFGDRVTLDQAGWMSFAFGGIVLLTGVGPVAFGPALCAGVGLAIAASVLYSTASIIAKQLRTIPPQVTLLVQLAVGSLAVLPLASSPAIALGPRPVLWILALGVVHTGMLYVLIYGALQRLPTTAIAMLTFIYPGVAVVLDVICYGHIPGPPQVFGITMILVANVANARKWRFLLRSSRPRVDLQARV
ncbi:MAG TPA: DMT family transporter [Kofleriaceae bacterium]